MKNIVTITNHLNWLESFKAAQQDLVEIIHLEYVAKSPIGSSDSRVN